MKVARIEFGIDEGKGEISYRNYHSSQEVAGAMYIIVTKLLANDDVFFKLYQCDDNGANVLMQKAVPFAQFPMVLKALEADLQKKNPNVKMEETHGNKAGIAVGPNGTAVQSGNNLGDIMKGLAAKMAEQIGGDKAPRSGNGPDVDVSSSKPTDATSPRLGKFMQ